MTKILTENSGKKDRDKILTGTGGKNDRDKDTG